MACNGKYESEATEDRETFISRNQKEQPYLGSSNDIRLMATLNIGNDNVLDFKTLVKSMKIVDAGLVTHALRTRQRSFVMGLTQPRFEQTEKHQTQLLSKRTNERTNERASERVNFRETWEELFMHFTLSE